MKFTALFLLVACMQVAATGHAQITLSEKNSSLEKVFKKIKRQSGYVVFYNYELLKEAHPVTVELKDASIEDALVACFKDQPLSYEIINKTVVVKPLHTELPPSTYSPPPPIDIHGRILNEAGEPVIASIIVKGTSTGTVSDENGYFNLSYIDPNGVLVVSGVGIQTKEIKVNGRSELVITANIKITDMKDVIINKGYYTESQKLSTGNVSKVTSREIEKQPVSNPLLALQGRAPGLFIIQNKGMAGTGVRVQVQGRNSMGSGTVPLYIVDGIPYPAELSLMGNGPLGTGSPFNYINPADIESIEVLKDADATSIYGSRASNGAIIITTKRGKIGETKVDINVQNGWGQLTKKRKLLNTEQYIAMRLEAKANDNEPISSTDYDINGTYDQHKYTDWQKVLLGGTAQYTNAQANVSGGNKLTQFFLGAGYHRETSIFPGDFVNRKGSMHFNIVNKSLNEKFKVDFTGTFLIDENRQTNHDLTEVAMQLAPNAPDIYKPDGSLNWEQNADGVSTWQNPLAYTNYRYNNVTNNFIGNTIISYELVKGLELKSSFGTTRISSEETMLTPISLFKPEWRATAVRGANFGYSSSTSWIVQPQINYNAAIGKGKFEALVLATMDQRKSKLRSINATGFNSDEVMENLQAATSITPGANSETEYKAAGLASRVNYNYLDRYVVNLTARRDGSSRFGSENKFHNFGSVGLAWLFTNEKFMSHLPFFSFGKLRASYGTTGNDQIGEYSYMSLYSNTWSDLGYQGIRGLQPNNLANPYLQWEETRKLNLGIELGLLKDRIRLNVDYFKYRSSNQLMYNALPIITGFYGFSGNFPATLQNTGLEVVLNTINVNGKDFRWSSSFNITRNRNKIVEFPDLENSPYASSYFIGKSITTDQFFKFAGVDPQTGVYQFETHDGKLTSEPDWGLDRIVVKEKNPSFYGGFTNNFQYKGFELDVHLQFIKQIGQNDLFGNFPGYYTSSGAGNQPVEVMNRWQKPGDITNIQRFNTNYSIATPYFIAAYMSDVAFEDASFIRLKNVSLSWQVPQLIKSKLGLRNCRLFVNAENLATITNYKGLDPETQNSLALPPLRVITTGIQLTF